MSGLILLIFLSLTLDLSLGQGVQSLRKIYEVDQIPEGNSGNPGLKMRITKKGFGEIKDAFVAALNVELRKLFIPQYKVPGTGQYQITLAEMRVDHYSPATSSSVEMRPPNQVRMLISGINAGLGGKFTGGLGAAKASGTFTGNAQGVQIDVLMQAIRSGPRMTARISSCKTTLANADFDVNVEGIIGVIIKQRKGDLVNSFRQRLPEIVCNLIKHVMADVAAAIVGEVPVEIPLELVDSSKHSVPAPPHIQVLQRLQTNLKMDTAMIHDIVINDQFAETKHRGEIRYYDGLDSSLPFHPESVNDVPKVLNRSLYVTGSEYVFNSFMYHAYRRDKLDLKISRDLLPKGSEKFLDTTCKNSAPLKVKNGLKGLQSICVGKFIPALSENYPNNHTSFKVVPLGIPRFEMRDEGCYLNLTARIMTLIDEGWREFPVLVSRAKVLAKSLYEINTSTNRLVGDLKLEKFEMEVHRSGLRGLDPSNIESLGPLSKGILGKELKETAKQGIPLPKFKLLKLRRPEFKIGKGYGQIQSDLIIDQAKLEQILGAALKRGSNAVG